MPGIRLNANEVTLYIDAGVVPGAEGRSRLGYKVKTADWLRREVRLSTGGTLADLPGTMILYRGSGTKTDEAAHSDSKVIGTLDYIEPYSDDVTGDDPASFSIAAVVEPIQFDELVRAAMQNRVPHMILADAEGPGFKLGWEPDGSGKDWDNKEHPRIPVVSIVFVSRLWRDPSLPDDDAEDEPAPKLQAPTREQMDSLAAKLDSIAAGLKNVPSYLLWATVAIVIAIAIF